MRGLLVVRALQHRHQAIQHGSVSLLQRVDRLLREVVAENVLRIGGIHALARLVPDPGHVFRQPGLQALVLRIVRVERLAQGVERRHREFAEENREIGLPFLQRLEELAHELVIARLVQGGHAELARQFALPGGGERVGIERQTRLEFLLLRYQRQQGFREASEVPLRDVRLVAVAIPPSLRVGRVRRPLGLVTFQPAVGTIVDGEAEDRQVVGVHHAVYETEAHPVGHQLAGAAADFPEQIFDVVLFREKIPQNKIGQLPKRIVFPLGGEDLEIAEAHEGGRDAAHDGAGLGARVAVVEHVADHLVARAHQAQRARRRHAQVMHGFAAREFAQRRAQHRAAIGGARVGRAARALELQFLARAVGRDDFAQRDGAAVAQLPGPVAELVAAVARSIRLHAGQQAIAAEHLGRKSVRRRRAREAEHLCRFVGPCQQPRPGNRRRVDARVAGVLHLARPVHQHRVGRKRRDECVLEAQRIQIHGCGNAGGLRCVHPVFGLLTM